MLLFDQNSTLSEINTFLQKDLPILTTKERILKIEIAGEGNMNVVLRLTTNHRSFILKQSRPFVRKYPDLAAPIERIEVEHQFYHRMEQASFFPKVLAFSSKHYILLLEDLGICEDLTSLYQSKIVTDVLLNNLIKALYQIHQSPIAEYPKNLNLRQLNHQHIFDLPFASENDFSLEEVQVGLEALAIPYKENKALKEKISEAGKVYLQKGDTLLHGDYYPGSWMRVEGKLFIIDPEFSFIGPKSFDLGILAAHLIIATSDERLLERIVTAYPKEVDQSWVEIFCGIEILRRLLGLAQLSLERSLAEKEALLILAQRLILQKPIKNP